MKIINPSAELLDPKEYPSIYQFIEKIGRTCYKSEDHITDTSAAKFVSDLVKRGHWAMLEHGYVYMTLYGRMQEMLSTMDDKDKQYLHICGNKMSANLRAMYDFLFFSSCPHNIVWRSLKYRMQATYPEIFGSPEGYKPPETGFVLMDRTQFIEVCIHSKDYDALYQCLPHTILFHTDRGVTHEMVRHRPASFAQESTRYCNYAKGKFGSEITVVKPSWAITNPMKKEALYHDWKEGCQIEECLYMAMLKAGATPQEARAHLPHAVKADIIVTAVESEWNHIINLRAYGTTGAPHPDMQLVMMQAGTLLHNASGGRLYPHEYHPALKTADPTGKYYIFLHDEDNDLMPLKWLNESVLEFDSENSANVFLQAGIQIHFINPDMRPVVKENFFLDITDNHLDASGATLYLKEHSGFGLVLKDQTKI